MWKQFGQGGAVLGWMLGCVGPVWAAAHLDPVIVTANKIEQDAADVATSVTRLDGEMLREGFVQDLGSLARHAPGMSFQPLGQAGTQMPVVRGLSSQVTTFSSSMLMLVDGVPTLAGQGFADSLVGIERVEILRGPQSTLYGRNAEAGVLAIHTRQPEDGPYADIDMETGSRQRRAARLALGQTLVPDRLYLGLAGDWETQGGFIDNLQHGDDENDRTRQGGRLVLGWTPYEGGSVKLRYRRQAYDDGGSDWGALDAGRRAVRSGTDSWNRSQGETLSLEAGHHLANGWQLRSISALNRFVDNVRQDTDFQAAERFWVERDHALQTLSQELRLEGRSWVLGLYADRDDHALDFRQRTPMALTRTQADLGGDNAALFGQWQLDLSPRWGLILGARAERNRVDLAPADGQRQHDHWTRFTPKLAVQYRLDEQTQAYLSYAEGFRAGGYNAFAAAAGYPGYAPEQVDAYEAGLKGWAAGRRLRYAVAAYWMEVTDMQVQQLIGPGQVFISNAASAHSYGLELEGELLLGERWTVQAALGLNRTRFERYADAAGDYAGHHNPFAPDLTGRLGLRFDADSGWYAQAGLSGVGSSYLDAANRYEHPGHVLLDASTGYEHGRIGVAAYLENATDVRYDAVGYLNGTARVYSPPREFGLRVSYRL